MKGLTRIARAAACLAVAAALAGAGPAPAAATAPLQTGSGPAVTLTQLAQNLTRPTYVTGAGDGSGRLFVTEKRGVVRIFSNGAFLPTPFLDISARIGANVGNEQGLLSIAFHPQYATNRRFFVFYTKTSDGTLVVAEYSAAAGNANVANTSEKILLTIPHPGQTNHNGGQLQFGPDGRLYIGVGDGGSADDPPGNGQNTNVLLGKILRIDVGDGSGTYTSPSDNPFAGATAGRDEIYAYGFRNPWRFSFDSQSGALYAGDVGQNRYEEIDVVTKGGNYGWDVAEGFHCHEPATGCNISGLVDPIFEYEHNADPCSSSSGDRCSITGGYVYRGALSPALDGTYLFIDYCASSLYGFKGGSATCLLTDDRLSFATSFGRDDDGELYVVTDSQFGAPGYLFKIAGPAGGCALACPGDVTASDADGNGSEVVTFDAPTPSGQCGAVTCAPASGSTFQVGTTTVNCTSATGGASCSFDVVVEAGAGTFAVTGCNPSRASKRSTLDITINGAGFANGATVSFGPKVTVLATTVVSATEIVVTIKIKKKAKRGGRDVVVTNPGGATATGVGCFTVT